MPAQAKGTVAFTITWEAKPGEAEAAAEILRRMAAEVARSEPGALVFQAHRSASNDHAFVLYELFADEAAFAAHQQTPHFKSLILEQAVPKLAKRERVPLTPMG
jgi:quinol monooxygenase YgiN